jgi:hypothetical protein
VFADAGSFVVPTGGAVTTHSWADWGGSPAVVAGAENSSTVTYRYTTAGYYYVIYTVVDANGKQGRVYIPVIIDDGTYGISGVVPGDREFDKSVKGWKLSRDLMGLETDETKFYDGAPVFLVADDTQVADSAFAANRSNLRWSGWLIEDDTSRAARSRKIRYRAVSTNHILQTIPAYPIRIGTSASPADWYNIKTANTDALTLYLMHWHSTVHRVCDYHPTGEFASRLRAGERCRSENILHQLNHVLAGPVADLRCDRQGILRAIRSEWHLSAAEQAAITTVMTLGLSDHRATVREIKAGGVDGSSNPYLSGAPGAAPLDGGRPEEFMSLAPNSQNELNQWCGQELSVRNWSIPTVVKMAGEYDVVDPALGEFVIFNADTLFNEDKLPDGYFSIDGVRFTDNHEQGYSLAEWELIPDPSAYGAYGSETRDIPVEPDEPPAPDPDEPDYPDPVPNPEWPVNGYFAAIGSVANATGGVWHTSTFTDPDTATQPTWTRLAVSGSWPADNLIKSFGIDVSEPEEYVYAMTTTARGIIRYSDTAGTWSTILTEATVQASYAGAIIRDMMVDRVTGYLYALADITNNPNSYQVLCRCTNPSAGVPAWGYVASATQWLRGDGNMWVYNDQVTYCHTGNTGPASYYHWIDISTGGGAWSRTRMKQVANTNIRHFHNQDSVDVYCTRSDSYKMAYWQIGAAADTLADVCSTASSQAVWDRGVVEDQLPLFMPDPSDASALRFVPNYSAALKGHLLTTDDKFQTYTDQGLLDIGTAAGTAPRHVSMIVDELNASDYDMIVYGSNDPVNGNEHTIYAAYGSTDITPVGKSGANPDTGVDSIPYTAGGPCWRGIQFYDVV